MELANPLRLASSDESVFTIQTGWIWTAGASLCQPPEWDGDQPQPGGGGARAGRPGLRGHVPGGHLGQAGQSDAQGARPCCLSTIYHLIPRPFSILTMTKKLLYWKFHNLVPNQLYFTRCILGRGREMDGK